MNDHTKTEPATLPERKTTVAGCPLPDLPVLDRLMELGATNAKIMRDKCGEAFAIVPNGCKVLDLSAYVGMDHIQQRVTLLEPRSFTDYVNRFKHDSTQIFVGVHTAGASFLAALDYHQPAPGLEPAPCSHLACYSTLATPEWTNWLQHDHEEMDQVAFATFLEENQKLFRQPDGAALLELVETLHGKSNVRFTTGVRLQSGGSKLHYDEDVELRGGAGGDVVIPKEILVGIQPFQGAEHYAVQARLKYRISSHKLVLYYETIGVVKIIRDAIMDLTATISTNTGITPYLGQMHE